MYVSDTPDMEYNTYESNNDYDKCNIYIYIHVTLTVYHCMFACIAKRTSS